MTRRLSEWIGDCGVRQNPKRCASLIQEIIITLVGLTERMLSSHNKDMITIKTQIVFPQSVLEELDRVVKKRERSDFVVDAVEEKLNRLRLEQSLRKAVGIWKERKEMRTDAQARKYLKQLRGADTRRSKRLHKILRNG